MCGQTLLSDGHSCNVHESDLKSQNSVSPDRVFVAAHQRALDETGR